MADGIQTAPSCSNRNVAFYEEHQKVADWRSGDRRTWRYAVQSTEYGVL